MLSSICISRYDMVEYKKKIQSMIMERISLADVDGIELVFTFKCHARPQMGYSPAQDPPIGRIEGYSHAILVIFSTVM